MDRKLPGIEYMSDYTNMKESPSIDSDNSMYQIPFFKDSSYLDNIESYQKFIKGCEDQVHKSDRYSKYKAYLINEKKLDHCQVLPNLTTEDADIDMHHGPVFTLYDYCRIVVEWYLLKSMKITTFRIANTVLDEHEKDRVQVIMLSTSIHHEVQNRNMFLSMKQAWGDINAFVSKYKAAIPDDLKEKMNRYIDRSIMSESDDYGMLSLNSKLWEGNV